MASTFSGLEIGKSGLAAAQIALNITGQNISNADTLGYTMQRVNTAAVPPVGAGYLIRQINATSNVGQGVSVVSIDQVRSAYLDAQYRDQYAEFCDSEFMAQGLGYLENLFNETNEDTSITNSISDFFSAMSDFADDTTSEAARTAVQQMALSMTENFNMIYEEMLDLYNDQNASVKTVASQINELASQIADLNKQIFEYERSGESANELRDSRNVLLDKLSGYAGISYEEDSSGMVNISMAGESLVDGQAYSTISISSASDEVNDICSQLATLNADITAAGAITTAQETQRDGLIAALGLISDKVSCTVSAATGTTAVSITYVDHTTTTETTATLVSGAVATPATSAALKEYNGANEEFVLKIGTGQPTYLSTENITSGELHAHMLLRDGGASEESGIPYYVERLDEMARTMAQTVNTCMNKGYTYPDDENGNTSVTGVDMFADFSNSYSRITAGNFTLSTEVLNSVWNLAASSEQINLNATSGTTNAANNEIANELYELFNTNSFSDRLDSIISHLGIEVYSCNNELDTRQSLLESTENQRQSVSGVSVDEEAVNLIKYEQVYSACSRMITTIDEILDRLINGTGKVGL